MAYQSLCISLCPMRLSYIVLSLCFLAGCKGEVKIEGSFTEEELSWLAYKDGDNLLFQNVDSVGDEVTMFISGTEQPTQLRTYYPIEAEITASNPEQGECFKVYLLKDEREFKRYIKFGDVYRPFEPVEPLAQLKVGEQTYNEVYLFKEDSISSGSQKINEVYYAKGFGVVQYVTHDGRVFQLSNNHISQGKPNE